MIGGNDECLNYKCKTNKNKTLAWSMQRVEELQEIEYKTKKEKRDQF